MMDISYSSDRKCSHEGCELSCYLGSDVCPFHLDYIMLNMLDSSTLKAYLEDASNPERTAKYSESGRAVLMISGIDFSEKTAKRLVNRLPRAIYFRNCKFESKHFFSGATFDFSVWFENCEFAFVEQHELEIQGCKFNALSFEKMSIPIVFSDKCLFNGPIIRAVDFPDPHNRCQTTFVKCHFGGNSLLNASTVGDVEYSNCEARVELRLSTQFGKASFDYCDFSEHTVIYVAEESSLSIRHLNCKDGLSIIGEDTDRPIPEEMRIERLSTRGSGRISFSNVNLSTLNSKDYRFAFSEFDNVVFPRVLKENGRFCIPAELECQRLIGKHDGPKSDEEILRLLTYLEESYSNIKAAYDRNANYVLANYFHAGELWAQWQLQRIRYGKLKSAFTWHGLYHFASDFGQSWIRPLSVIMGISAVAIALYAIIGTYPINQWSEIHNTLTYRICNGFTYGLQKFAFWFKTPGVRTLIPFHWMGWLVAFLQTSITLVAGTFFILALRRRFKR